MGPGRDHSGDAARAGALAGPLRRRVDGRRHRPSLRPLPAATDGEQHADAIPGASDLFEALRARGIKIGSSTGYVTEFMAKLLPAGAANGIAPDHVCSASDVAVGRPAPRMIYAGAKQLGIYPMARVLVVYGRLAGIRAARNAACWAVGVVESGNEFWLSAESLAALPAAERAERYALAAARLLEAGAHEVIASVASLLPVLEGLEARLTRGERP